MSYIDKIERLKDRFEEMGDVEDYEDAQMLSGYIAALEKMLDDYDVKGGDWRGELDDDYSESH